MIPKVIRERVIFDTLMVDRNIRYIKKNTVKTIYKPGIINNIVIV